MVTVRVLSTVHDVADARLGRIVGALSGHSGVRVLLEATGSPDGAPDGADAVLVVPRGAARARAWRALRTPFRGEEDVLVVVDPELVLPAVVAARLRRRRLVVDVHEDYRDVARDRPWVRGLVGVVARLVVRVVLAAARRADLVTVADEHVPPLRARRRLVVPNLPDPAALPAAGPPGPRPRAVYIGDIRPSRGLWTMLDAVAATDDWTLDLVGDVAEVPLDDLRRTLTDRGLADRVTLHGRLPLAEAWAVAEGAWVGLSLLDQTPAYVAALPTKVYEYLAVGVPVLSTPLPRVRVLLDEANAGRCVADSAEAASTLRDWSAHPAELTAMRRHARAWADHHLVGASPFDDFAAATLSLVQDGTAP